MINLKIKARNLITQSLFISFKKREFLLLLIDGLSKDKLIKLIEILETEKESITRIIKQKFKNDIDSDLSQKIKEFFRSDSKLVRNEVEDLDHKEELKILNKLDEKISKI